MQWIKCLSVCLILSGGACRHDYETIGLGQSALGTLTTRSAVYKVCISRPAEAWLRSSMDGIVLTYGEQGVSEESSGWPEVVGPEQRRRLLHSGCFTLVVSKGADDKRQVPFEIGVR